MIHLRHIVVATYTYMKTNNYHQRIPEILDDRFVKYDDIARAIATALASGKNVLLYGPGGHAKSDMVETVLKGLDLWDNAFVESFGEGMTEDTLWGGINLDALNAEQGARIEYHPEYSFLNFETAVFEEMLDAPSPVLLGLKDTLTRKELRKGAQRYGMKTKVILACTNHSPDTYADSDDPADKARRALLERFPIQIEVKWDKYLARDYNSMFKKHHLYDTIGSDADKLGEILAEATREGHFVSPRTAIHALEMVYANSLDRGHSSIKGEDMADIKLLAGLDRFGENLLEEIDQMSRIADARTKLEALTTRLDGYQQDAEDNFDDPIAVMQAAKRIDVLKQEVFDVEVPDELYGERDELAQRAEDLRARYSDSAWDQVQT